MPPFYHSSRLFFAVVAFSLATISMAEDAADSHNSRLAGHNTKSVMETLPFGVTVHGNFKRMMHTGDYAPKVRLGEVLSGSGVYAVGALSGLRGEITVIDGKPYVSLGSPGASRLMTGGEHNEEATLLVAAKTNRWKKIPILNDMSQAEFEAFVTQSARKEGVDMSKPFPFMLNGNVSNYKMHVVAGPNPKGAGHGHGHGHGASEGQYNASGGLIKGRLVGFYSGTGLSGVISHPGEFFHVHIVDEKEAISAHMDSYGIGKQSTLLIPEK